MILIDQVWSADNRTICLIKTLTKKIRETVIRLLFSYQGVEPNSQRYFANLPKLRWVKTIERVHRTRGTNLIYVNTHSVLCKLYFAYADDNKCRFDPCPGVSIFGRKYFKPIIDRSHSNWRVNCFSAVDLPQLTEAPKWRWCSIERWPKTPSPRDKPVNGTLCISGRGNTHQNASDSVSDENKWQNSVVTDLFGYDYPSRLWQYWATLHEKLVNHEEFAQKYVGYSRHAEVRSGRYEMRIQSS